MILLIYILLIMFLLWVTSMLTSAVLINVSHFGNMLNTLCNDENQVIADKRFLDSEAFTFVSSAHNTCSWLDHAVTTHTGCSIITCIEEITDFVTSDDIPMYIELDFKGLLNVEWSL